MHVKYNLTHVFPIPLACRALRGRNSPHIDLITGQSVTRFSKSSFKPEAVDALRKNVWGLVVGTRGKENVCAEQLSGNTNGGKRVIDSLQILPSIFSVYLIGRKCHFQNLVDVALSYNNSSILVCFDITRLEFLIFKRHRGYLEGKTLQIALLPRGDIKFILEFFSVYP